MFILKITNKASGQVQQSDFPTMIECEQHFAYYNAQEFWGKDAYTVFFPEQIIHHDEVPAVIVHHDETLETRDEAGLILTPYYPPHDEVVAEGVAAYDEVIPEYSVNYEAEFIKEIIDVTAQYELAKRISDLVDSGKQDEAVCKQCLNLIGGYNKERALTSAQIQTMVSSFASIDFCLSKFMPRSAKVLINAITPDESIITTELKNLMLEILKEY
jgi:hypothetical protein